MDNVDQALTMSNMRTNNLFRTRAISQERGDRINDEGSFMPKNTVTAPKTFRKISRVL